MKRTFKGYSPSKIQSLLHEKGITQKQVADEHGVSPMQVSRVVRFVETGSVSDHLMRAISEKLGVHHRIVFADYYGRYRAANGL